MIISIIHVQKKFLPLFARAIANCAGVNGFFLQKFAKNAKNVNKGKKNRYS